jgi:hypothetical protein
MNKPYITSRSAIRLILALYKEASAPIIRLKDSLHRRHPSSRFEIDSTQLDIDLVADDSMPFPVKIWVLVDTRTGAIIGWIQFKIPAKTTRAAQPIHRGEIGLFLWSQN